MACTECHAAKVKCDKILPCARCVRLNRACIRHESQQGRRKGTSSNSSSRKRGRKHADDCDIQISTRPRDGLQPSEDAAVSTELDCFPSIKSDNYGLNYLVRSWISLAFTRRSFSLLSRASAIAARCGLHMDQMLCEREHQRGMDFLYPILLTPSIDQRVIGEPIRYSELPPNLLTAVGLPLPQQLQNNNKDLSFMGNRWIWIREQYKGFIRLLCSPAFERDIVSMPLMEATYEANKMAMVDLFLDEKDRYKQVRGLAQQVFSVHKTKGVTPKLTRLSCIQLKCNLSTTPIEVDQFNCLSIVDLDHSFYFWEYVRREPTPVEPNVTAKPPDVETAAAPAFDNHELLDVDDWEWDDSELNEILDFLG